MDIICRFKWFPVWESEVVGDDDGAGFEFFEELFFEFGHDVCGGIEGDDVVGREVGGEVGLIKYFYIVKLLYC